MGLFSNAKDEHRKALAAATRLVERHRIAGDTFNVKSAPLEFRRDLHARLTNLLWHLENTPEAEIGDGDTLRELRQDVHVAALISEGKYSLETQRNFRTLAFDAAVEALAGMPKDRSLWEGPTSVFSRLLLADWIESGEVVLSWFADLPAPKSTKYSAAQAQTILALAKEFLAKLPDPATKASRARTPSPAEVASPPAQPRTCAGCEAVNDADATFCKRCGAKLSSTTCPGCQLTNDEDASFCKRCGTALRPAPAGATSLPELQPTSSAENSTPRGRAKPAPLVPLRACPSCGQKNKGDAYQCSHCKHLFGR